MLAAPSTAEPEAGEGWEFVVDCAALAYSPPDTRPPPEWGEEFIHIPNSARGAKRFYRSTNPMFNEPLCRSVDPRVRRLVIMAPTGAGKTTLFDIRTPYAIAQSLGSILIAMQSDPDADDYCEKRLNKILDACLPVLALKPTGSKAANLIKLNSRTYQELTLDVGGPGKSNRQRKSVQWVGIDEAWLLVYGAILEFEARLHDRWNGQLCLVSQGAEQTVHDQKIELDEYWKTTNQAELQFRCPTCGHVQPYWWDWETKQYSLRYDLVRRENGSVDLNATAATARIVCENPECKAEFADTYENRRMLAESLNDDPEQFKATAEPEKESYVGRHWNALAMFWVAWATLTVEWLKAVAAQKDGDTVPMMTFVTKRLARTYWLPKKSAVVVLTAAKYKLADYWKQGTRIDSEFARFMGIDFQMGHWWALVRAFRANCTSRLLYAAKITSEQQLVNIQEQFEVTNRRVLVDCNYERGLVFNMCARHDWIALEGDDVPGYPQTVVDANGKRSSILRYYSQPNDTAAPEGGVCQRILFSRVGVTDETVKLRDNPDVDHWAHGEDTPEDWHKHAVSEEKVQGKGRGSKPTFRYERIKQRRNDLWWCEVACTLGAIILGILRPEPPPVDSAGNAGGVEQPGSSAGS